MPHKKNLNELASFILLDVTLNSDHEDTYAPKEKNRQRYVPKRNEQASEYQCVNNSK